MFFKIPLADIFFTFDSLIHKNDDEPSDFLRELSTWLVVEVGIHGEKWGLVNKSVNEEEITPYIWFKNEEDAVAFKLTWCGQ